MHPLANDEVFLFILDGLQTRCQISDFSLNGQHLAIVGHVDDAVHVEAAFSVSLLSRT
jgi:hypothetical protein